MDRLGNFTKVTTRTTFTVLRAKVVSKGCRIQIDGVDVQTIAPSPYRMREWSYTPNKSIPVGITIYPMGETWLEYDGQGNATHPAVPFLYSCGNCWLGKSFYMFGRESYGEQVRIAPSFDCVGQQYCGQGSTAFLAADTTKTLFSPLNKGDFGLFLRGVVTPTVPGPQSSLLEFKLDIREASTSFFNTGFTFIVPWDEPWYVGFILPWTPDWAPGLNMRIYQIVLEPPCGTFGADGTCKWHLFVADRSEFKVQQMIPDTGGL